jgi:hypothetical protein
VKKEKEKKAPKSNNSLKAYIRILKKKEKKK